MGRRPRYSLVYAPQVHAHLKSLDRRHLRLLRDSIEQQLLSAPLEQTRNRKPLERSPGPFGATWELRCGPENRFRIFYEVMESERQVWILAVGNKEGNRLRIGGKEFVL